MPGLLVADDEDIVRQTIISVVENSGLDLRPVEEARTGQEAVTVAQHLRPAIVLMDVKMPGMNGLEATRAIRTLVPAAKVIILSAHDEFSFSQEALRLGAVDYLLKPIRPATLIAALSRIKTDLQREQETQNTAIEARNRLQAALPLLESRLVQEMIHPAVSPTTAGVTGRSSAKEIADQLGDYLGKEIVWPAVMVIEVDEPSRLEGMRDSARSPASLAGANGLLRDIVQRALVDLPAESCGVGGTQSRSGAEAAFRVGGSALLAQDGPNTVVLVVSAEGEPDSVEMLRSLGHKIRAAVESGAPVTATVTIGRRYPTLDLVHVSYAEALRAQWLKLSLGGNTVIHIEDARRPGGVVQAYPMALERDLIRQIRVGQIVKCQELLSKLVDYLLEIPFDPPEMIHTRFVELVALISRAVIETGAASSAVLHMSHERVVALNGLRSGPELRTWAQHTLEGLLGQVSHGRRPGDEVVEQAVHFMDENFYRPDLQLKQVATATHVSPSHLAHLLRTHVGASYVKYLTLLRMEEAKRLLRETDLKVATIAVRTGYEDPAYFYRVFRREIGVTPSHYRRRARAM